MKFKLKEVYDDNVKAYDDNRHWSVQVVACFDVLETDPQLWGESVKCVKEAMKIVKCVKEPMKIVYNYKCKVDKRTHQYRKSYKNCL